MKNSLDINKSRTATTETTNVSSEISKIGITAVTITAAVIGCWALASMVAGVINNGGPIDLAVSLFKAITG